MCTISQISFIPSHKVAVNLGLNINYALPNLVSSIYNPAIWARMITHESNPIMTFFDKFIESESEQSRNFTWKTETTTEEVTTPTISDEYDDTTTDSTEDDEARSMRRKRSDPEVNGDMTAAEFYLGLKDMLLLYEIFKNISLSVYNNIN